ncbi:hypothetical protein [Methylobacterium dankookense]|uniref:Uncharacterized protein n=1 Tax=Methylobacterium dankookense TaxID=560405 RepID=A0A564FYU3_9HYPH|nr:hypothetical protein [Methylobacterium dankookense]GJD58874.1 hypothetical protein IFDJLNFL_4800 [Methylobacterium dankookense]VUF13333.1 hypothetical protein MTDSW087_03035 [Methylobacterium dankookense]
MTKSRRSVRRGPVVINDNAKASNDSRRTGPQFVEAPHGPLPGHLLVLLSRLHRSESARSSEPPGPQSV